MAKIAEALSDFIWITSDNPRSEDPIQILAEMETGFKASPAAIRPSPIDVPRFVRSCARHNLETRS